MLVRMKRMACLLACLALLPLPARARVVAPDITQLCCFASPGSKTSVRPLSDQSCEYPFLSARRKTPYVEVTAPAGQKIYGVMIRWAKLCPAWEIQVPDGKGWRGLCAGNSEYLTTYTELGGLERFRIAGQLRVSDALQINELNVLGAGDTPDWVQRWQPTCQKADLLLVVAHPDDEYVFMGGMIPYYAAEKGKQVLVAYITESTVQRRAELLDGLWLAGLRQYPLLGRFHDRYSMKLTEAYKRLGKKQTNRYMVELFRHYRPDVVVTHDVKGEYGHAVHKLCADIVRNAAAASADETQWPESAREYGVLDVPKVYLHLWPEGQLRMDWQAPLAAFDGETAASVASRAFKCHISQQDTPYRVYLDGTYDSQLYGLYRSLVGPDAQKNDLFENVDKYVPAPLAGSEFEVQ